MIFSEIAKQFKLEVRCVAFNKDDKVWVWFREDDKQFQFEVRNVAFNEAEEV